MAPKKPEDDTSLKRLGGGRWQTRDERFTIEPQSGTWVLVDAEQTDDLGLPLVRGPFRSLTDAKAAVQAARGADAPESPLAERLKGGKSASSPAAAAASTGEKPKAAVRQRAEPEPPAEPRWIGELVSRERGRARRLIERLSEAGVRDAEGVVRQDLTGGVPTIARLALADAIAALFAGSSDDSAIERALGRLVETLDEGRDEDLGVRWRLVDGEDRPVGLTAGDIRAAIKRRGDDTGKGRSK